MAFEITPEFYQRLIDGDKEAHNLLRANKMTVLKPNQIKAIQDREYAVKTNPGLHGDFKQVMAVNKGVDFWKVMLQKNDRWYLFDEYQKAMSQDPWGMKRDIWEDVLGGLSAFLMVVPALGSIGGLSSSVVKTAVASLSTTTKAASAANTATKVLGTATGIATAAPSAISPATSSLLGNVSSVATSLIDDVIALGSSATVKNLSAAGSAIGSAATVYNQMEQSKALQESISNANKDLAGITVPYLPPIPPAIISDGKNTVVTDTSKDSGLQTGEVLPPITVSATPDNTPMLLLLMGLAGGFYFLRRNN